MELLKLNLTFPNKQHLLISPPHHNTTTTTTTHHSISITFSSPNSSRRALNFSLFSLLLSSSCFPFITTPNYAFAVDTNTKLQEQSQLQLERYTDAYQGFTLLKPSSYIQVEKAGATVLFEEENKGANNVGVVVNPVRITSLQDFGTPQFVANKLILAEKRKESTKDAEVIGVSERPGLDGLPVYEFEYVVDSTRGGMKRVFSAAFVSGKKLYLLNITHSDKPESPLDSSTRTMLEKVLQSFDVVPMT